MEPLPSELRIAVAVARERRLAALDDDARRQAMDLLDRVESLAYRTLACRTEIDQDATLSVVGKRQRLAQVQRDLLRELQPLQAERERRLAALRKEEEAAVHEALPELTPTQQLREQEIRQQLTAMDERQRRAVALDAYRRHDWETIGAIRRAPAIYGHLVAEDALAQGRAAALQDSAATREPLRQHATIANDVVGALETLVESLK